MWEHVFSQKRLFKVPQLITVFFQNFFKNGIYLVIKEENCMIFLDYKYHVEIEPDSLL